jgi:UDP-N-acetylmuramoyl-L-alanyl-D-glutamate--2,6-diaminopimelate ligase
MLTISQIFSGVKSKFEIAPSLDSCGLQPVEEITLDSRLAKKNSIFFALPGQSQNGEKFIDDALKNGATVIVSTSKRAEGGHIQIICEDVFALLVEVLQIFYTPLPANIYAITGTNGKTSSAEFTRQILNFLGKKSASVGTLGVFSSHEIEGLQQSSLTTPDIVSLYKNLQILKKNGVDDVALEVSSIGLHQGRIAGLKISVGAFTNFTQDHLDYHKSMEEYLRCKTLLFSSVLENSATVVLNCDIEEFPLIKKTCDERNLKVIEYGFKAHQLKLQKIEQLDFGQRVFFEFSQKTYSFELSTSGDFQAFNAVCALGNVLAKNPLSEEELSELLKNFNQLQPAPGRMQRVATLPNGAQVFIDFAHSPDALKNVLQLAKKISKARVLVLFGCGGNRDAAKRPLMGAIASDLADLVIVSDDNPRKEDAALIRKEILQKCDMTKTLEIAGRKDAIIHALKILQPSDILILAGKGHEKYQIIGEEKFKFDEEEIVKNALKN